MYEARMYEWSGSDWSKLGSDIQGNEGSLFGRTTRLSSDGLNLVICSPINSSAMV